MNKRAIWIIIFLMSAGLFGSVLIQMNFIRETLQGNKVKFRNSVHDALKEVAQFLEESENEELERTSKFKRKMLGQEDLLTDNNYNSNLGSISKDESKIKLDDFTWNKENNIPSITDLKESMKLFKTYEPIEERIGDFDKIDDVIGGYLKLNGIHLDYHYGIYSNIKNDFVVIDGGYSYFSPTEGMSVVNDQNPELFETEFEVPLFESPGSPGSLRLIFPNEQSFVWRDLLPLLLGSVLFTSLILFCFSYVIYVIFRQKKVSEMKNDFINNMTHEFKTPIATISLAVDSINSPMVSNDKSKVQRFAGIIKQENTRMLSQVEKVLQMALLDREDFSLKLSDVNLHDVINRAVEHSNLQVIARGGQVSADLDAKDSVVEGDITHISNMIYNLLDNANKYTPDNPDIKVITENIPNGLAVTVKDNGIGLTNEARKHIFDKFYRVHTGNLHDVKGFGLGLSYVKAMITAHKGSVEVQSELGKGSSFTLYFPFKQRA